MNETDVREIVVRPLLHELGYRHGTEATIRTEVNLRYNRAFLGRKKPSDPELSELRGRADYICEVVAVGRWVVEVKAPNEELTIDDAQQAHSYAAHPEIAALYYLLTNGRDFALYRTSYPTDPLLSWRYEDTSDKLPVLHNLLGPAAITKVVSRPIDLGKPLAQGVGSKLKLVGGFLTYQKYQSDNPLFSGNLQALQGHRATVIGREVVRSKEGKIVGKLELAGASSVADAVNRLAGIETYGFISSDEYISSDIEKPTVFQNFIEASLPAGLRIPQSPTNPEMTLPFPIKMAAYTNAAGFIDGSNFVGIFEIDHEIELVGIPAGQQIPSTVRFYAEGDFRIAFSE